MAAAFNVGMSFLRCCLWGTGVACKVPLACVVRCTPPGAAGVSTGPLLLGRDRQLLDFRLGCALPPGLLM